MRSRAVARFSCEIKHSSPLPPSPARPFPKNSLGASSQNVVREGGRGPLTRAGLRQRTASSRGPHAIAGGLCRCAPRVAIQDDARGTRRREPELEQYRRTVGHR